LQLPVPAAKATEQQDRWSNIGFWWISGQNVAYIGSYFVEIQKFIYKI